MNSNSVFFWRRLVVPNWCSNDVCAYSSQVKFMWSASNGHSFFSLLWAVWTILGLQWLFLPIVQFREGLTNCSLVLEHDHKIILSSSPASKKAKTFQKFSQSCPHVLSKLSKCCLQVVKKLSSSCVQKQSMEFPSSVKWRRLECYDNLHQIFRDFDT